jgi:shikimate dehydrogenase
VANNLDCNDGIITGTQWYTLGSGPVASNQALWTTLALDANNTPFIGYYEDYNKGTVRSFTSGWSAVGSSLFTPSRTTHNDLAFDPSGATVLILGAGGAARGAVAALCGSGVIKITVANRTQENSAALVGSFSDKYPNIEFGLSSLEKDELADPLGVADLLVNTTSVGMSGTSFPGLDLQVMMTDAKVYDMVYSPPLTTLLVAAKRRNLSCANGLGMLAAQGEAAFYLWTGFAPPEEIMKTRLLEKMAL